LPAYRGRAPRNESEAGTVDRKDLMEKAMPRPENTPDHEYERLNPGASADPPQPQPAGKAKPKINSAALPGSPNADLKGVKRDRRPRGMST
jgi:hypothetical protein